MQIHLRIGLGHWDSYTAHMAIWRLEHEAHLASVVGAFRVAG